MRKNLLFISIYILCSLAGDAQTALSDSLLKLLPAAKEDAAKVLLYVSIGNEYENNEPEKAKQYYRQAILLSRKLNDNKGYYKALTYISNTFIVQGNLDSMLYFNEQALAVAREMKDSMNIGVSLFNVGVAYRERYEFEKAIAYCLEGRAIMEKKQNKKVEVQMNDALQVLYNYRTEYDKAILYGEKAVQQSRELNLKGFLAQSLLNLSLSYGEKGDLQKAEVLVKEALQIAVELKDVRYEATALQNLAGIFLKKGDYVQLETYAERSLILYRQIGSVDGEAIALRGLAVCNLQQKNLVKAKDFAEQALLIDRKNKFKKEEASILRVLSAIYFAAGDVKNGLKYDLESEAVLEAMVKDVLSENSANLEKKYETQKKESQIKQLEAEKKVQQLSIKQKNIFNYILIGGLASLLLISLLGFRTYRQKQKLQQQRISELETQQQLTATEAVLKGEEQERTRLAKDLHDGLGGMLSGIKYSFNTMKGNLIMTPDNAQAFERSMDMLDSSIKEMRRVAHNMMPEALVKFGLDTALKDFCNDINQTGALGITYQSIGLEGQEINQTTAITIYRIVQELINNTMKHAGAKAAIVQLTKSGNQISVTVEDDGKGFDTAILHQSKGIGWTNIQNRVDFLKGKLDVNSEAGKGTSVLIELTV
jgi:signal transduction histidine kinase